MPEPISENIGDQSIDNAFIELWHRLSSGPKIIITVGLILLAVGATLSFKSIFAGDSTVEIIQATPSTLSATTETRKGIFVDVSGAVVNPGVYQLQNGDRLQNALIAAGGLGANADREYAAKNLNLAAKLSDGQKIYVPFVSDPPNLSNMTNKTNGSIPAGLINLNSASSFELDTLPGVGPATAAKIISNRPYADIQDLITKKVVSQKVFDGLKDKVSVY